MAEARVWITSCRIALARAIPGDELEREVDRMMREADPNQGRLNFESARSFAPKPDDGVTTEAAPA
jgi:hypothetical protein